MSIRLLIVDDQALARAGFRKILESEPGLEVVAEAEDGLAAVDAAARGRPDVVLMDIRMPRLDGIAATRRIVERAADRLRVRSNAEIARTLVVSDATVKTHVAHVLMKLGVRDRVQAVIYAYESGLIQPGQAPAA